MTYYFYLGAGDPASSSLTTEAKYDLKRHGQQPAPERGQLRPPEWPTSPGSQAACESTQLSEHIGHEGTQGMKDDAFSALCIRSC
jgi:hypothetical protein